MDFIIAFRPTQLRLGDVEVEFVKSQQRELEHDLAVLKDWIL